MSWTFFFFLVIRSATLHVWIEAEIEEKFSSGLKHAIIQALNKKHARGPNKDTPSKSCPAHKRQVARQYNSCIRTYSRSGKAAFFFFICAVNCSVWNVCGISNLSILCPCPTGKCPNKIFFLQSSAYIGEIETCSTSPKKRSITINMHSNKGPLRHEPIPAGCFGGCGKTFPSF